MDMLGLVVHGLPRVDTLLPAVQALGRRHVQYGVQPEHYQTVGAALLWALEQELGAAWTPAVREAWTTAYTVLAELMTAAAGEPSRPAPPPPQGLSPGFTKNDEGAHILYTGGERSRPCLGNIRLTRAYGRMTHSRRS